MSEDGAVELGSGRGWWRALLTLFCVAAVLVASVALPAFAGETGPAAQFNLDQPLEGGESAGGGGGGGAGGSGIGGFGGLGALSPGDQVQAGGAPGSPTNPYSSLNREVHFTVRSDTPAYWRTGAYDSYTGQGWERTGESTPLDGPIPVEGAAGERVGYAVTLERSATGLPTVWRPTDISLDDDAIRLGPERAISSSQPVPAGTSYTAQSVAPPDDPALLRTAGTDYPADVASTYAALPTREDTARVANFTDELTANASTPYETATTIEAWLERNKSYSLNASHDPEAGTITSEFLFEMDRGYCEYFATAMTTMLRSQDVPARYVVGYATGEQTGPDEYTVRGMHAHAWVEVYFPEVGWVRFDPTPADDRTEAEQAALGETPTEGTPTSAPTAAEGTKTSTAIPVEGTGTETETTTGTETATPTPTPTATTTEPSLDVSLNRSAVPGATVELTVTRDGEPVEGAEVLFNGDSIGTTDANGTVVGTVPYTDRLDVTVRTDSAGGVPSLADGRFAIDGYTVQTAENTSYTLDTNASVSLAGELRSDAAVTLVATVDDVPVRDAVVLRDGERIGRTDDRGRFDLRLPSEPGEYEYAVERGSVSGDRTVTIRSLDLTASVGWPVAVPYAPVTLNATLDGESVGNASLAVGGEDAGTTGVGGTATRRLPLADAVTFTATAHGQRAETEITGLYTTLGGIVAGLLVGAVALFGGAYRRGITPRSVLGIAARTLGRSYRLLVIGLVSIADTLSRGVGAVVDGVRRVAERLVELARELRARSKTPGEVARIVANAVTAWARGVVASVRALPGRVRAWVVASRATEAAVDTEGSTESAPEDPETAAARERVRDAWRRFVAMLPLRRVRTLTPGEVARIAVDDVNLPAGPVERLRDAYREVAYGGADPASRQEAAEEAVDSLERERSEAGDGGESA
ncbi:DUF3488 domain-containing protein [Halolamina sp. CBA1230]|uniref:transglutaminaseTgpA domain-containing protein n=1 Tax=Halolamina sp. CBA1230 TaxID=1853690 RepID=UPI001301D6FB|nr:transglutaminaseTgpA domain-containing protein [Halolamina sp. CBA1230]QKY19021.1 DUF3488 domain-containing protein [Halolamina sp. CBA1230]